MHTYFPPPQNHWPQGGQSQYGNPRGLISSILGAIRSGAGYLWAFLKVILVINGSVATIITYELLCTMADMRTSATECQRLTEFTKELKALEEDGSFNTTMANQTAEDRLRLIDEYNGAKKAIMRRLDQKKHT